MWGETETHKHKTRNEPNVFTIRQYAAANNDADATKHGEA